MGKIITYCTVCTDVKGVFRGKGVIREVLAPVTGLNCFISFSLLVVSLSHSHPCHEG